MTSSFFRNNNFLRKLSWAMFILSFSAPSLWAWSQVSKFEIAYPEGGCGLPILAIYSIAFIGAGIFSLAAGCLNFIAFIKLAKPRPVLRLAEFVILFMPAIFLVVVFVLFLI